MAVSQRAPSLAYALRAGLEEDLLSDSDAEPLLLACERHAAELADEAKYSTGHNHGLAQDEALYLLARQLSVLPAAEEWSDLAISRIRVTLSATISEREGVHLEHSSSYQFAITSMVSRLCTMMTSWPELHQVHDRLRQTSAWYVTPSGRIAQLGDSDDDPAPRWATVESSQQGGLKALYEGGNAFVRRDNSYLAVSCGYHSGAHKHADDTGFLLVEHGVTVFGDAGRWGYYESEPDRRYARSAQAHNVLTVDDQDFDWRSAKPYGSGLLTACEGYGWYAVLAANPLLASQGVTHRRLLLYRPAEALVVLDNVGAHDVHEYVRYFHFGSQLDAHLDDAGEIVTIGSGLAGTLMDPNRISKIELSHGQDQPTRTGWTYPADRTRIPVHTAAIRCQARTGCLAAAFTLDDANLAIKRAKFNDDHAIVETSKGVLEVAGLASDESQAEIHLTPTG